MNPKMALRHIAEALLLAALVTSCTISPKRVESGSASFSGNEMNSGVIGGYPGGGFIVDDVFRAKYVALCAKYAKDFPSAYAGDLKPLPSGYWYCDRETMADMLAMSDLNRTGILPKDK